MSVRGVDDLQLIVNCKECLKKNVTIHLTFIKIGEINTLKECFDADILVRSTWRVEELDVVDGKTPEPLRNADGELKASKYWNPNLYIDNVVGEPKINQSHSLDYDANGQAYILERKRFKGTFLEQMELWEFPFDVQDLSIVVMAEWPKTMVELHEDKDEIHKIFRQSFIDEQEWYLYKYIESESKELLKDRADPSVKRSALMVRAKAARHYGYFLSNSFAVVLLIACLAFVTFSVKEDLPHNRLQLSFTLVLTSVAFKFVVNQSLPKISYLTYMDRYILAAMICLVLVCFYHGIQTLLPLANYPRKDYYAMLVIGGVYLIYNIQFILRLILLPFRKRRDLLRRETDYRRTVREQAELKMSKAKQSSPEQRKGAHPV